MSHLGTRGDISQEHGDNVSDHQDATEGGDSADGKASPQIVNNGGIFYGIRTMSDLTWGKPTCFSRLLKHGHGLWF